MSHILPLQLPITKFNKQTERLILGYIRSIEITKWIIPSSILELCITYYHSKLIIIYFNNPIKITDLDSISKKCYSTTISPLDDTVNPLKFTGGPPGYDCPSRVCYVEDFQIPPTLLKTNKHFSESNVYSAIIRITDMDSNVYIDAKWFQDTDCSMYIIDINADDKYKIYDDEFIDIYHWKLPHNNNTNGSFPLYSQKHGMIAIGKGFNNILNFNDYGTHKWQWKEMEWGADLDALSAASCSAIFIDEDRFICCNAEKCSVFDFSCLQWSVMSDKNMMRENNGICFDDHNKKVFVGGGPVFGGGYDLYDKETIANKATFECFNLNKNKWNTLCCSNKKHAYNPMMWMEDVNMLHIASSSSRVFEKMDLRENKWTVYIDKQQFKAIFGTTYKTNSRLCI